MRLPRPRLVLALVLAAVASRPLVLRAAEDAAAGGGATELIGKTVNFVILFGGLFVLLRKPIAALLAKRSADIRASLEEARLARESAARMLAEAKARVASLEEEIARIRREAQEDAEREAKRIQASAEAEAERLRRLAEQEIDAQLKAGLRDLKAYAAGLAASLAEASLKDKLTAADQAALIDRSIERIGSLHEQGRPR